MPDSEGTPRLCRTSSFVVAVLLGPSPAHIQLTIICTASQVSPTRAAGGGDQNMMANMHTSNVPWPQTQTRSHIICTHRTQRHDTQTPSRVHATWLNGMALGGVVAWSAVRRICTMPPQGGSHWHFCDTQRNIGGHNPSRRCPDCVRFLTLSPTLGCQCESDSL